jgi:hypothetical protein
MSHLSPPEASKDQTENPGKAISRPTPQSMDHCTAKAIELDAANSQDSLLKEAHLTTEAEECDPRKRFGRITIDKDGLEDQAIDDLTKEKSKKDSNSRTEFAVVLKDNACKTAPNC